MKLHLGCGTRRIPGFYHIDIIQTGHVDLVHSVDSLPMIKDGEADVVYSSHVLEHISRVRTHEVLAEWYRILRPGGVFRVAVPDFAALARLYLDLVKQSADERAKDRYGNILSSALARTIGPVVGGQTGIYDFHQALFDFKSLKYQLVECGFVDVHRYDWRATEHAHVDDYASSFYPHMDKDHGVLLSLNVEATK